MMWTSIAALCASFQVSPAAPAQQPYVRYLVESFAPDHCELLRPFAGRPLERGEVSELRFFWQAHYLDLRDERLPDELAAFAARYPYTSWEARRVERSAVKGLPRVLYANAEVSVAETLDAGSVRETEVAVARRDGSGNFDFYVYDARGKIAVESTFPIGPRPAPTMCAACHFDPESGKFTRSPAR